MGNLGFAATIPPGKPRWFRQLQIAPSNPRPLGAETVTLSTFGVPERPDGSLAGSTMES